MCIRDSSYADQGSKDSNDKGVCQVSQSVEIHRLDHVFEGKGHIPVSYTHLDVYKRQGFR